MSKTDICKYKTEINLFKVLMIGFDQGGLTPDISPHHDLIDERRVGRLMRGFFWQSQSTKSTDGWTIEHSGALHCRQPLLSEVQRITLQWVF